MKTYILAAVLSLGSFSAFSSVITGQGQANGFGGNVDCEYPQSLHEFQEKAQKEADKDARQKCRQEMANPYVTLKRLSDYENTVSCYYKGPWMSISVININVKATYDCY